MFAFINDLRKLRNGAKRNEAILSFLFSVTLWEFLFNSADKKKNNSVKTLSAIITKKREMLSNMTSIFYHNRDIQSITEHKWG